MATNLRKTLPRGSSWWPSVFLTSCLTTSMVLSRFSSFERGLDGLHIRHVLPRVKDDLVTRLESLVDLFGSVDTIIREHKEQCAAYREGERVAEECMSIGVNMNSFRRLVALGPPGAGKS
ncbi:hypothetical protein F4859DRAFT_519422 [Xylaria cf. heliscus]|nr:hypothetical protein F4859DRAFT_519422 [Xylaria cf. heliscus]